MDVQMTQDSIEQQLETVDRATLTPLVRRALDSATVEISEWNYRPIYGGAGDVGTGQSGIVRFAGSGRDRDQTVSWSLILKVIGSPAQGGDPQGGIRERLAYQSGVLNDLSGSLIAPRCFDVVEQPKGAFWLWLEEVIDEIGPQWPLERYGLVARHLGQFNGSYLTGEALPNWPWLSRDWLRTLIAPNASAMAQLDDVLHHPLVSRIYPADVATRLSRLWAEREIFLAALDRLPQTLCHRDAFRRNLFVRCNGDSHEQTVAVDWAFVGLGAVGEEIVPLVQGSLAFFEVEQTKTQVLDELVFNGYLEGLRDVGWDCDWRDVRFGYAATSALRYGLGFIAFALDLTVNFDESKNAFVKQVWGCPVEELLDRWANLLRFLFDLADEARTLLGEGYGQNW
jgi:hypothetical protein